MKKTLCRTLTVFALIFTLLFTALPVSAATLLDPGEKATFTVSCSKPGYTFNVYNVGTIETTNTSPYETSYKTTVSGIEDAIKDGDTAAALAVLDNIDENDLPKAVGSFKSSEVQKTFTLEHGIYYIKAVNFPAGVKSVTNSLVALPYYNSTDGWIYTLPDTINLANKVEEDVPVTHKKITNSTKDNPNYTDVSLGDTVEFEIRSTTTGSSSMKTKNYTVYDDMSAGLTLNNNSFNVALLREDGSKVADLTNKTDYTVNITQQEDGKNTTFHVALTNAFLQKEDFYASDVYYTSITYSAVLNKHAVVGTAGNPNEEVKLAYINKTGVRDEVEGNTVYVYTYAVTTDKKDPDGKPLAGAEFGLYKSEENAKAGTNAIATGVSDENGKVLYYNGKNEEIRLQSGTYYIKELKAPAGYNMYGNVIEITIDAEYGDTLVNGTYVTNCPQDGYASVDVTNTKLVAPKTGGMGVMVYYIGAACLAAGSALFFIASKMKKKAEK